MKGLIRAIILVVLFGSCSPAIVNDKQAKSYLIDWMQDREVIHQANGYSIGIKPVPAEYLALNELSGNGIIDADEFRTTVESYGQGLYFLLNISPDQELRKGDIMLQDVKSYDEYKERFLELSFDLYEMLKLEFGDTELPVSLVSTEHSFGLSEHRTAMIAFVPQTGQQEELLSSTNDIQIVLDDRIFKTGISVFSFDQEELNDLRPILF